MKQMQVMSVATSFDPTNGAIEYGRVYSTPAPAQGDGVSLPRGWWLVPGAIVGVALWAMIILGVVSLIY